jgi:hypothetical protein
MENIIIYYDFKNGQIDINRAKLFIGEDEHEIRHLTNGGYFSKSALVPFFEYTETDECGQRCLAISDEVAQLILKTCCNLNGKVWNGHSAPLHESIAERNELRYSAGVSMEGVKGIDY